MDKINVLVMTDINPAMKAEIAAVDPGRINMVDASKVWSAPDVGDGLEGAAEDPALDQLLQEAEVIYGYRPPPNVFKRAPKLKWYQTMLAGVDHFLTPDLIKSDIMITNMSGVHSSPVAEVALTMFMMLAKNAPYFMENKRLGVWEREWEPILIDGLTAGVVGLGNIGHNIARLCRALNMEVLATRRSAKAGDKEEFVDKMYPLADLDAMLPLCDVVFMVLPNTPESKHVLDARRLALLKPSAYIINVGRGLTIDEQAMAEALRDGRIAGVGLDAYEKEPLPPNSLLWQLPNAVLSPHVSGKMKDYDARTNKIFCDNLRRYINGEPLRNVVNKEMGY